MENNQSEKTNPWLKKVGDIILDILVFLFSIPITRVSEQVALVSVILFLLILSLDIIFTTGTEKSVTLKGFFSGEHNKLLTMAGSFCLGCIVFSMVVPRIQEHIERPKVLALQEKVGQDCGLYSAAAYYLHEKNMEPSEESLYEIGVPQRLHKLTLGFYHLVVNSYDSAKVHFYADTTGNPITDYYKGLCLYYGLDDVPEKDSGLVMIRSAAEQQVIHAQIFLFYKAVAEEKQVEASKWADVIINYPIPVLAFPPALFKTFTEKDFFPFLSGYQLNVISDKRVVYSVMIERLIEWEEYSRAKRLLKEYIKSMDYSNNSSDGFDHAVSNDYFIGSTSMRILLADGNIPKAKWYIRRGVKAGNCYYMTLRAKQLLGITDYGENEIVDDKVLASVDDAHFKKAEALLRESVAKGDMEAGHLLKRLYHARDFDSLSWETDHLMSAIRLMKKVEK